MTFNYINKIVDPTDIVIQYPTKDLPNFLLESNSWQALNISIDSESFHQGMSYYDFVKQYVNKEKFSNEENKPVLEKMLRCANNIFDKLKPIEELGVRISLFLAGGSVREMVMGKTHLIKDFDFFVSFHPLETNLNEKKFSKETLLNHPKISQLRELNPEHLFYKCMENYSPYHFNSSYQKSFQDTTKDNQIISQDTESVNIALSNNWGQVSNESWYLYMVVLADLLLQEFDSTLYSKASLLVNSKTYDGLVDDNTIVGIIKVKNLEAPCDIMFMENSIYHFASFDWEICKAGLILYHNKSLNILSSTPSVNSPESSIASPYFPSIPSSSEECVSRFFSVGDFFKDIANKTLTYKVLYSPVPVLNNEMSKRRKRLKNKYPDFKVNWNLNHLYTKNNPEENIKNDIEIITIKTLIEESTLEELIPINDEIPIRAKILKF